MAASDDKEQPQVAQANAVLNGMTANSTNGAEGELALAFHLARIFHRRFN